MKHSGFDVRQPIGSDGNPTFSSLEKARNWLKGLKKLLAKRATAEQFPVTTASYGERMRYIVHGIGLLNPIDYPSNRREQIEMYKNLLSALAQGYHRKIIARMSGCSEETLKLHEKEAIKCVKEAIHRARKRGLPIVGGLN